MRVTGTGTTALLSGALLLIVGCSGDEPQDPADAQACETYEQAVETAEDGDEQGMMGGLETAYYEAETDRLVDLIDDLMIGMEEEAQVDSDSVNSIRSWCGIG